MTQPPNSFVYVSDEEKGKILQALRDPKYTWRTADGVSQASGISVEKVRQIMAQMTDEVVIPRAVTPSGQQLYGSREHILKNSSLFDSISGAFTNRLY